MIESLGQGTQFVKCFGSFYINMAILKACVQDNLHNSNIFLYTIQRLLKISLAQHLKRKKKNNTKEKQELAQFQLSLLALYSKRAVWPAASSLSTKQHTKTSELFFIMGRHFHHSKILKLQIRCRSHRYE